MSLTNTPANWAAGEFPTAAKMQAEIHDLSAGLQAAWDTYVPVWSAATTAPNPGSDATLFGRYWRAGKTVHARCQITLGTVGNGLTFGSGAYGLSLPVPLLDGIFRGIAWVIDASAGNSYNAFTWGGAAGVSILKLQTPGTQGLFTNVASASPFAFATGDTLGMQVTYEAA